MRDRKQCVRGRECELSAGRPRERRPLETGLLDDCMDTQLWVPMEPAAGGILPAPRFALRRRLPGHAWPLKAHEAKTRLGHVSGSSDYFLRRNSRGGRIKPGAIISRSNPDDPRRHPDSDATIRHLDIDDAVGTDDCSTADPDSG